MDTVQVYGYYFSRVRANFQLDSGFPKRLPADISFSPSGALRWINGHQILLSVSNCFCTFIYQLADGARTSKRVYCCLIGVRYVYATQILVRKVKPAKLQLAKKTNH